MGGAGLGGCGGADGSEGGRGGGAGHGARGRSRGVAAGGGVDEGLEGGRELAEEGGDGLGEGPAGDVLLAEGRELDAGKDGLAEEVLDRDERRAGDAADDARREDEAERVLDKDGRAGADDAVRAALAGGHLVEDEAEADDVPVRGLELRAREHARVVRRAARHRDLVVRELHAAPAVDQHVPAVQVRVRAADLLQVQQALEDLPPVVRDVVRAQTARRTCACAWRSERVRTAALDREACGRGGVVDDVAQAPARREGAHGHEGRARARVVDEAQGRDVRVPQEAEALQHRRLLLLAVERERRVHHRHHAHHALDAPGLQHRQRRRAHRLAALLLEQRLLLLQEHRRLGRPRPAAPAFGNPCRGFSVVCSVSMEESCENKQKSDEWKWRGWGGVRVERKKRKRERGESGGNKLDTYERKKLLDVDEDGGKGELRGARQELERHDVLVERRARGGDEGVAAAAEALGAAEAKALGERDTLGRTARLVEDEPAQTAVVLPVRERERPVAAVALEARLVLLPLGHARSRAQRHLLFRSVCVAKKHSKSKKKRKKAKQKKKKEKKWKNGERSQSLFPIGFGETQE